MFTKEVRPLNAQDKDSFMEVARLKKGTLFDEVFIRKIDFHSFGVEIVYDYERHGVRHRDVPPALFSKQDWATARASATAGSTPDERRNLLAQSLVVERLFSEGSRYYNDNLRHAEEDFAADADFISGLADGS